MLRVQKTFTSHNYILYYYYRLYCWLQRKSNANPIHSVAVQSFPKLRVFLGRRMTNSILFVCVRVGGSVCVSHRYEVGTLGKNKSQGRPKYGDISALWMKTTPNFPWNKRLCTERLLRSQLLDFIVNFENWFPFQNKSQVRRFIISPITVAWAKYWLAGNLLALSTAKWIFSAKFVALIVYFLNWNSYGHHVIIYSINAVWIPSE